MGGMSFLEACFGFVSGSNVTVESSLPDCLGGMNKL